jgi:predicted PurR-regulated permease PerM
VTPTSPNAAVELSDVRPPPPATQVPPSSAPELRTLLALAVAVLVIAALYIAQEVLVPITLAVILSFVLSPLVNLLGRLGVWRPPAVIASILLALGAIALVALLIGNQAAALSADAPQYAETIGRKVQGTQEFAAAHLASLTRLVPGIWRQPAAPAQTRPTAVRTRTPANPNTPLLVEIAKPEASPFVVARAILTPVLGPLETTVIVLVVAIFILIQKEDLRDRCIRLVGTADLNRTTMAIDDATQRLSRYFVSQLAVNTTFGFVIGVGLWAIGVPSPAVWGFLAGLLRFAPYVGPVLAAIAPIGLAAAIDPGWSKAAYVATLFVVVEPLTGYVVEPLLYGHSTGLSPISVIVAAIFWTWLWGPIGLILSTPLTLCLVVVGRHAKSLEFFDVILGDRPALPAVDRLYQRVLAEDPDEVLAQAETFLAQHTLTEYYDDVLLPGLRMAARDSARGSIAPERASEITRSMIAIVGELGRLTATKETDAPRSALAADAGVVACVAGRGRFDDVVSAMLAQLLERAGVSTRLVSHRSVSRETMGQLDTAGVTAFALSYLEITGSPAHLRYLVARLRQRAPNALVIAGLWAAGEAGLTDAETQRFVGADRYVTSLREAVDAARGAGAKTTVAPRPASV